MSTTIFFSLILFSHSVTKIRRIISENYSHHFLRIENNEFRIPIKEFTEIIVGIFLNTKHQEFLENIFTISMISEPCVLHARDDDDFKSIQYIHVSFLSLFNHAINLAEALTIREMFFRELRFADIKP